MSLFLSLTTFLLLYFENEFEIHQVNVPMTIRGGKDAGKQCGKAILGSNQDNTGRCSGMFQASWNMTLFYAAE